MVRAILLSVWAIICIYDILGPTLIMGFRPLIASTGAGIIVGNVQLGMAIGATLELAALGVYTYGGATIPDYQTGGIIGTTLAAAGGASLAEATAVGITIGLPAAVLLASLDPIGRFLPTFWIHRADRHAAMANARGLGVMHWTAFIPWAAVRVVPTFIAALALNTTSVASFQENIPQGFVNGMILVGSILPAVGFAMLLKIMPVRRYWYFLLIGFVLFAYLNMPLLGIALFGLAIAILYVTLKPAPGRAVVAGGSGEPVPGTPRGGAVRG
jgi:mannose/fructose/N-acetylgalactosamine-specific phosphotransferase system component IIC